MLKGREAVANMFRNIRRPGLVAAALVSVAGIVLVGMAGMSKENEFAGGGEEEGCRGNSTSRRGSWWRSSPD